MSAGNPVVDAQSPIPARARPRAALWRTVAAFVLVLVGMTAMAGWMADSSLIWLGWIALGVAAGLLAGSARSVWIVALATILVYPLTALLGRTDPLVRPMLDLWAILVLVGGMVTAGGLAIGAMVAERRIGWISGVSLAVGLIGAALWVGASAFMGSTEMVVAKSVWDHCDNPMSMYGWTYEAINYDQADDARVADGPGGTENCTSQGEKAGTEVVTEDGIGIAGWYIPAGNGAAATAPTIIVAPGWKSNKSEVLKYAPFFHDQYNIVMLDLRNQGRSGGDTTTWGVREKLDVKAMVDWLERTKQPSWIGATGNSMGAASVLAAAAEDPRIRALVLDSMHADVVNTFSDGVPNERKLPGLPSAWAIVAASSMRSGADIPSANPVLKLGQMGDRPVLLIHGTNDVLDTVDHAAKPNLAAAEAAGVPVTMHYCEGGGHGGLVNKCPDDWQAWVDEFLATVTDLEVTSGSTTDSRVVRVSVSPDGVDIEPSQVHGGPVSLVTESDGTQLAVIAAGEPRHGVLRGLTDAQVDAVMRGDLTGMHVASGFATSPTGAPSELGVLSVGKYIFLPAGIVTLEQGAYDSIPQEAVAVLEVVP